MEERDLTDRHVRHQTLITQRKLRAFPVTIVGIGAGGRQAALQLGVMGIGTMMLVDPQKVEAVNLGCQGFYEEDLGEYKAEATSADIRATDSSVHVVSHNRAFINEDASGSQVLFCCVDSIATRREIFNVWKAYGRYFADGRMRGDTIRTLSAYNEYTKSI
jgi:sulfur carrier protein ThiS adenylyltransferase